MISSLRPLSIFVSCEPDAIGMTIWSGSRQPSCSQISYARVLEPSRVVRAQVDVDEAPALAQRVADQLGAEAVDVVVVALDADQLAAVDRGHDDLARLQVVRDEHAGARSPARAAAAPTAPARLPVEEQERVVKPKARAASTAMATTRSLKECVGLPESSLTYRPPVTPSSRGEVVGLDELGQAGVQVRLVGHVGGDGQQRGVAPDVGGPGLDLLPQRLGVAGSAGRTRPRAARNTPGTRRSGRAGSAVPHSRQDSAAAGPRVDGGRWLRVATVCTAMEARPFLLIFLATHLATRRNWHLPQPGASRAGHQRPGGETGWRVAGASTGRSLCPSG